MRKKNKLWVSQVLISNYIIKPQSSKQYGTGTKKRHLVQQNRMKSPETNSHLCRHLIYKKGIKIIQWVKIPSSINCAGEPGKLHAKESNWAAFSHYITKINSGLPYDSAISLLSFVPFFQRKQNVPYLSIIKKSMKSCFLWQHGWT